MNEPTTVVYQQATTAMLHRRHNCGVDEPDALQPLPAGDDRRRDRAVPEVPKVLDVMTGGQRNALVALAAHRERRGTIAFARPFGVQTRTLFALRDLGLARTQIHISGVSAKITVAGLRALDREQS